MTKVIFYPVLEDLIEKRGVVRARIARAIGVSYRAFWNKMRGAVPFTWPEACTIQSQFFPDITKEELFKVG